MLNTEQDLNELLAEIQQKQFNLEYTKVLAHYFIKASPSQRKEINNFIKQSPLFDSIQEYLEVPKVIKVMSKDLKSFPEFYEVQLSEESERLINDSANYEVQLELEKVPGTISEFTEKVSESNTILSQLSGIWDSSKKRLVASVVVAAILAPATFNLSSGIQWNSLNEHFSFQSTKKNYAKILNEGLVELSKSKSSRLNEVLQDLSDKEMAFFVKNLEKQEETNNTLDKKTLEIQLAIEHYYNYKVKKSYEIAQSIKVNAQKYNIDPVLFLSIMKVESDFDQSATNASGDFSVAQINYKIWSKAFKELGKEPLDKEKLKTDVHYSIERMAEILSYLSERYSSTDPLWYARYHNWKPKFKLPYAKKVNRQLATLTDLKMDKIAEKLLQMKALALRVAEVEHSVDLEKVETFVAALEEIHLEYSASKELIAFNQE